MKTTIPHITENNLLVGHDDKPIVIFCAPQDISNPNNSDPIIGIDTIKVGYQVRPEDIDFEGWNKCEWSKVQIDGDCLDAFLLLTDTSRLLMAL